MDVKQPLFQHTHIHTYDKVVAFIITSELVFTITLHPMSENLLLNLLKYTQVEE